MALVGIAAPRRSRGLPETTQREFDQWYEWLLRLNSFVGNSGLILPVFLFGATNTIQPEHVNKNLIVSHTSAATLILGGAITQMKLGSVLYVTQAEAAGPVTVTAGSGVTINTAETTTTRKQWSVLGILKTGVATALCHGDMELF